VTTQPARSPQTRPRSRRTEHPQRTEILAILTEARIRIDRINAPIGA